MTQAQKVYQALKTAGKSGLTAWNLSGRIAEGYSYVPEPSIRRAIFSLRQAGTIITTTRRYGLIYYRLGR